MQSEPGNRSPSLLATNICPGSRTLASPHGTVVVGGKGAGRWRWRKGVVGGSCAPTLRLAQARLPQAPPLCLALPSPWSRMSSIHRSERWTMDGYHCVEQHLPLRLGSATGQSLLVALCIGHHVLDGRKPTALWAGPSLRGMLPPGELTGLRTARRAPNVKARFQAQAMASKALWLAKDAGRNRGWRGKPQPW